MNKTNQNIEKIFKTSHLAGSKRTAPVFSAGWETNLMNEIGYTAAAMPHQNRNDETPLNTFAFRLGWAMLGLAFVFSSVLYFAGINSLYKTDSGSKSSLWEFVDQNANIYDINLFNKTDKGVVKK